MEEEPNTLGMFFGICVGGPWHGQNFAHFKTRVEITHVSTIDVSDMIIKKDGAYVPIEWHGVYILEDTEWKWHSVENVSKS